MAMCLCPCNKAEEQAKVKMAKAEQSNQTNEGPKSLHTKHTKCATGACKDQAMTQTLTCTMHNGKGNTNPGHYGLAAEGDPSPQRSQ
jgi:hypothetical protein